jgi:hypothetical protein
MSGLVVGNAVVIQYVAGEGLVTTAAYVAVAAWLLLRAGDLRAMAAVNTSTTLNQPQPIPAAGR